jgi:hypothetical protein
MYATFSRAIRNRKFIPVSEIQLSDVKHMKYTLTQTNKTSVIKTYKAEIRYNVKIV